MNKHVLKKSPFKEWLTDHHIAQRPAASALQLSVSSLNKKLNGQVAWLGNDLKKIKKVYGLPSDFVLGLKMPRHEDPSRDRGLDHQKDSTSEIQSDSISSNLTLAKEGGLR